MRSKWCIVLAILIIGLAAFGGGEKVAVFKTLGGWEMPPGYHGNPYVAGGVGVANDYIYMILAGYDPFTGEFWPYLATSWEEAPEKLTVYLRKDITWEDGTPLTSKDVYTNFYLSGGVWTWSHIWKYVDRIETPDDYTVVFHYYKPNILMKVILLSWEWIRTPYHIFGKWLPEARALVELRQVMWRMEEAGQDVSLLREYIEKREAALKESLKEYKPEFPMGSGPFKVALVTPDTFVLEKRQDTPWAKTLKIDKIEIGRFTTNELAWAAFMAGEVDLEKPATPVDVVESILKAQPKIKHIPVADFASFCLAFNHTRYPFGEKAFRQALAYIIDRDKVRVLSLFYGTTVEYPTGLLPSQLEFWTTPEFREKLNTYPVDHEKAGKLLEGLGLVKGPDGFWATPDGKTLTFEITVRSDYTDWVIAAEEIARQLTAFGIKTGAKVVDGAIFGKTLAARDFDMAIEFGVFAKFHPVQGYKRLYYPGEWIAKISGYSPIFEGVDLNKLQEELWVTSDLAKQKEIIETLAQKTNEYLPMLEFLEKNAQFFVADGIRVTGWPYGPELENKFGFNWRLGSVKWMIEGILVPVDPVE